MLRYILENGDAPYDHSCCRHRRRNLHRRASSSARSATMPAAPSTSSSSTARSIRRRRRPSGSRRRSRQSDTARRIESRSQAPAPRADRRARRARCDRPAGVERHARAAHERRIDARTPESLSGENDRTTSKPNFATTPKTSRRPPGCSAGTATTICWPRRTRPRGKFSTRRCRTGRCSSRAKTATSPGPTRRRSSLPASPVRREIRSRGSS